MSTFKAWLFSAMMLLLARLSEELDLGTNVYKEDTIYMAADPTDTTEGFVSYLDPAATRKYQFATENDNMAITSSLEPPMFQTTFSRLFRTTTSQILIVIVNSRQLRVISVAPANKGAVLLQKDMFDASDTTTKCVDAVALVDHVYAVCIKPGATVIADVYAVKSYKFAGTAEDLSYAFSPKSLTTGLTVQQASIRVGQHAVYATTIILLFNRVSLQSIASNVDVAGANTKTIYVVDYSSTASTKEKYLDITAVDQKANVGVKIPNFGLVYDLRMINDRVQVLTSSGSTKVPAIFIFEFTGASGDRNLVNWEAAAAAPLSTETTTYTAELCHNQATYCVRGVTSVSPKKLYHHDYTVDATGGITAFSAVVANLKTWNDAYPVRFDSCDISATNQICNQVYSESSTDGAPNMSIFELFQIERATQAATPNVKLDRVYRLSFAVGGFHEFSTQTAASIAEGADFFSFLLSDATAVKNKQNYVVLNAFRFTPVQAFSVPITKVTNNEATVANVDVTFTLKDMLSTVTAPASTIKSAICVGCYRSVPLTTDPVGQGLRLAVSGTNAQSLVYLDNEIDLADRLQNPIPTASVYTFSLENVLLTLSKTQPAPLRAFWCTNVQNYTSANLKGNCSYLSEQPNFSGSLIKARILTSSFSCLFFKASATLSTLVSIKAQSVKTTTISDSVIDAEFYVKTNADGSSTPYLAYLYSSGTTFALKILKIDSDGSSLSSVSQTLTTDTFFSIPVQIVGFYSEISIAVLDINPSTFRHAVITLKPDSTTPSKLIVDKVASFWRQNLRNTADLKACYYRSVNRLVYWYPASKIGGVAVLTNDFELYSFGLNELAISEIQTISCEYSSKMSFSLVGKTTVGTATKSVAYTYFANTINNPGSKMGTYMADFKILYDSVIPVYNQSSLRWFFSGYAGEKGLVRVLLNSPEIFVKTSVIGDTAVTLETSNLVKTVPATLTLTSTAYDPVTLTSRLATGKSILPNQNYSFNDLVDTLLMPVMSLSLTSADTFALSLVKILPRLRLHSNLEPVAARRLLAEEGQGRRLLQGTQGTLPSFLIVKDGVTLVVYKFSTGTKGYIYKQTNTFAKNFDFPGGNGITISNLDFRADAIGTGAVHIFYYTADNNLNYLKVGIEKLDTTFTSVLPVKSFSAQTLVSFRMTTNDKYTAFTIMVYVRNTAKYHFWGVKINTDVSPVTATFADRINIDSKQY